MARRKTEIPLLPHHDWPATDRRVWECALRPGGLFADAGPAAHWSERSRRTVASGYGKWLGYLRKQGHLTTGCRAERVTPEAVAGYVTALSRHVSSVTVWNYVKHLYDAVRVMAPGQDWRWLRGICAALSRDAKSPGDKGYRVQDSGVLFELGLSLMARAEAGEYARAIDQAIDYRDGLMIALLAARPLRRRNLAALELGRHLTPGDGVWLLHLDASETKQRRPYECTLPAPLTHWIARYLATYRLQFPGADMHRFLWASAKGSALSEDGVYRRIIHHTTIAFARPVHPHLFRDCAATSIARRDPAHVQAAAALLGHADLRTTERYYNQATALEAARGFQGAIAALRERLEAEDTE